MDIKTRVAPVLKVLANQKYELDVYQRGYVWTESEIRKFLTDLEDHARDWLDEETAPPWFLGTILVEQRGGRNFLVDGQQRMVTLGLLLLALHPIATGSRLAGVALALKGDAGALAMPVAVGRYQLAFAALARGAKPAAFTQRDPDQQRIANAYFQIRDWVQTAIKPRDHQEFIEGVLRACILNVVTVEDTNLAYRLFNSLNSRGKPLSPVETLKSVLLSDVPEAERNAIADAWDRARVEAQARGSDDPTLTALRSALIARAAPTAGPGTAFASSAEIRMIRDNPFEWLAQERDDGPPAEHIARELPFFMRLDGRLAAAQGQPAPGAEALHFIEATGLPREYWAPMLMAPLTPDQADPDLNARKSAAVITFLDIVAARLAWRRLPISPAQSRDALAGLAPLVREGDPESLSYGLAALLEGHFPESFSPHPALRVGGDGMPKSTAKALLARLTAYLETYTANPIGDYAHFIKDSYILTPAPAAMGPQTPGRPAQDPLEAVRDRLAAWVLTPADLAARLDAAPPGERPDILSQADNRLACTASASPAKDDTYEQAKTELTPPPPEGVAAHEADIAAREIAYAALARRIWTPDRIMQAAADPQPALIELLGFAR